MATAWEIYKKKREEQQSAQEATTATGSQKVSPWQAYKAKREESGILTGNTRMDDLYKSVQTRANQVAKTAKSVQSLYQFGNLDDFKQMAKSSRSDIQLLRDYYTKYSTEADSYNRGKLLELDRIEKLLTGAEENMKVRDSYETYEDYEQAYRQYVDALRMHGQSRDEYDSRRSGETKKEKAQKDAARAEDERRKMELLERYANERTQPEIAADIEASRKRQQDIRYEMDEYRSAANAADALAGTDMRAAVMKRKEAEGAEERASTRLWLEQHKEQQLQDEMYWNRYFAYEALQNNADFAEKSKYKTTETGEESNFSALAEQYDTSSAFSDVYYDAINKNERALGMLGTNASMAQKLGGIDRSERQQMSDKEIATFNYIYAVDGADAAYRYVDFLSDELRSRQREQIQEYARKYAEEHPAISSAFSVVANSMKGVGELAAVADFVTDGTLEQDAGYNRASYMANSIRNQVSSKWGPVGSFAYQIGMSMADFLYNAAVTGGISGLEGTAGQWASNAALAIMGSSAAADATLEAKDRGVSDDQAFSLGIIAGAAEIATEKISLDALLKVPKVKDEAVRYLLENIASEGAEEGLSDIINWTADVLISQNESEWRRSITEKQSEGYTQEQAFWRAIADKAIEIGLDTLGGAISGGIMAGVPVAGQTIQNQYWKNAEKKADKQRAADAKAEQKARADAQEADAGITGNEPWAKEMPKELLQEARDRGYGTTEAVVLDSAYKDHAKHEKNPLSPKEYAKRFDAAYIYGKTGTSLTATYGKKEVRGLTRPTIKAAHELGAQAYQAATYRNTSVSDQTKDAYIAELNEKLASGEISEREYDRAFDDYYQGGESETAELRRTQTVRNETTRQEENGLQMATQGTREQEVKGNETGESVLYEGSKRTGGADSRIAAGIVEEGAGRTESRKESARAISEKVDLENQLRDRKIGKVSTRAAGVPGGTQSEIITVVPNDIRTETMREAESFMKAEGFEKVKFVLGAMEIRDGRSGKVVKAEGFIDGANVWIRADSKLYTMHQLAAHESFHLASQMDPNLKVRLANRIMDEYGADFDAMIAKYIEAYQGCYGLDDPDAWDYIEEILADAYAGMNRQNLGADKYEKTVKEEVNQNKSQRETGAERKTGPPKKYAIEELEDGKKYVRADRQVIFGNDTQQWSEQLEDYINGKIRRGQDVKLVAEDGDVLTLTATSAGKLSDNHTSDGRTMSETAFERKANAAAHIDELTETSMRKGKVKQDVDGRHGSMADRGWQYRTAYFEDFDGKYYEITISAAMSENGNVVYNIGQMKEEAHPKIKGSYAKKGNGPRGFASSKISIADAGNSVKGKFSMEEPVEQTETLLAIHNKDWNFIRDAVMNWGGIPAPSIAIVEAKQGHTKYGDTSVIYPRSTIDPKADSRNKVYGSDAWTPTNRDAQVEYEVNYDAKRAFEDMIEELSGKFAGGAFRIGSVISSTGANSETSMTLDEIARKLAKYPAVQAAYLQSRGETMEPVYKKKSFDSFGNEALQAFIDRVGYQELARLDMEMTIGNTVGEEALEAARDIIIEDWVARNEWRLKQKPEIRERRIENQRKKLEDWRVENFIRHAWEYYEEYGATSDEIDTNATGAAMLEMILPDGSFDEVERVVQDWVRPKLEGILGETGIFNGKDRITDEGRMEFWETHYPFNAENIVRAMYEQGEERGGGIWNISSTGLVATATPEYGSVEEIHADEDRLRIIDEEDYKKLMRDLDVELERVEDEIMGTTQRQYDNDYEEEQNIGRVILQVAIGERTKQATKREFRKEGYTITDKQAQSILTLLDHAGSVPAGYFEAKPQRVVGFDEALAVIAPDSVPRKEIEEVKQRGVNILLYQEGNERQRVEIANSIKNARFSIAEEAKTAWNTDKEKRDIDEFLKVNQDWAKTIAEIREYADGKAAQRKNGLTDAQLEAMPKKGMDALRRARNSFTYKVSSALQVPVRANRNFLRSAVNAMMEAYMKTGEISQETKTALFEAAYEKGVVIDDEFYNQYKDVKKKLKDTAVTISEQDKADIADFALFKKQTSRTLNIKDSGGLPVDVFYQEMRETAPELFPEGITHPADQLQKLYEAARSIEVSKRSLDEYYGAEKETFKAWARGDFEQAAAEMESQLAKVRRFAEDQTVKEEQAPEITTVEQANEAYRELKRARREYEKANAKNLLTKKDKLLVDKLVRGEIGIEAIEDEQMSREITEVYEAAKDYRAAQKRIEQYRKGKRSDLMEKAKRDVGNAALWKDKKGILYMRETQERNIRDIAPDAETAERIIRDYIRPVHQNNAEATRMKNEYRERVKNLNVSRVIEKGNIISEAAAVQMIGEAEDNIRVLEKDNRFDAKRDGKTLKEWRAVVQKVWQENPNLDKEKINKAIRDFRTIYDELFQKMNEVRVRNGYEPVNYRQGYFPHFQPGQTDGIISLFAKAMGIDAEVTALPTSINGLTHTFRPGIQWFGPALERIGYNTAYDAVEGFDRYIEGVADVVWHTDDIQRLRALERAIRYLSTDEGIREQIDAVERNDALTMEQKEAETKRIFENARFALGNFAVDLSEYTNLLANKKHSMDRIVEQRIGRNFYNQAKALEGRVAANMVAINPASWLTNFIPLTQAGMEIDTKSMLEGMWQTLKAYKTDDGFADRSTFLTNRRGSDPLVKTWVQRTSQTLSKPMEYIDTFTADSIVRARYLQNVKRGMSEEMALSEADEFAAGVMADRSKGSMPTIFEARNPFIKLVTQFQLEVNNQLSWMFKDVPREMKDRGLKVIAAAIIKYVLGAFLYNEVYEYFIGRRPALDPIGILNDTVGDFTGYELPNLVAGVLEGDWDFKTEKKSALKAMKNVVDNFTDNIPGFDTLLGLVGMEGGRVPFSSSLPDVKEAGKALLDDDMSWEKRAEILLSEAAKPLAHWILPFGGGQIKKLAYGIEAVVRGGSYTVDSEGNDILQYPVFNETTGQKVGGAAKAVLFGKSALKGAQEWVESGFKSLSAKQTSAYKAMIAAGEGQMESWDVIDTIRKTKKTEDKSQEANQKQALAEADISDAAKVACYYALFADEEEQAKIETFVQAGMKMDAYLQMEYATAGIEADKDSKGESIDGTKKRKVLEAINALDVSDEQKDFLVEAAGYKPTVLTPWKYMDYAKFEQAVRTGKGMRDMVKEALNAGAEPGDITEIVTMLFKDEYINATASERADLKARIITVAEVMGGTSARNSRAKAVDKWLEGD